MLVTSPFYLLSMQSLCLYVKCVLKGNVENHVGKEISRPHERRLLTWKNSYVGCKSGGSKLAEIIKFVVWAVVNDLEKEKKRKKRIQLVVWARDLGLKRIKVNCMNRSYWLYECWIGLNSSILKKQLSNRSPY